MIKTLIIKIVSFEKEHRPGGLVSLTKNKI